MATFYSFIYLQKALNEAGCRFTRAYLNILEQSRIIPKPKNEIKIRTKATKGMMTARIYEKDEITRIVNVIKKL